MSGSALGHGSRSGNWLVWSDVDLGSPHEFLGEESVQRLEVQLVGEMHLSSGANDVDVLVTKQTQLHKSDLDALSQLRLISTWGVGYDHVDVEAAAASGIPVCINPVFTPSMAEAALTLILATGKQLRLLMDATEHWHEGSHVDLPRLSEVEGSTVGIVGFGRIGRHLDGFLAALGANRLINSPSLKPETLPARCEKAGLTELLRESDWVVLTVPLTAETHHMIGATELKLMKPTAYLINVARGELVDEEALAIALRRGEIAGAGLDVWAYEPPAEPNPLSQLHNVIATPHALGRTKNNVQRIQESVWQNIEALMSGAPLSNVVNQ